MAARHPQVQRLIDLGLPQEVTDHDPGPPPSADAVLAIHHNAVPAADLALLLRLDDKPGFVVDLTDLAEFVPVPGVEVPDRPRTGWAVSTGATTCGTGPRRRPPTSWPSAAAVR